MFHTTQYKNKSTNYYKEGKKIIKKSTNYYEYHYRYIVHITYTEPLAQTYQVLGTTAVCVALLIYCCSNNIIHNIWISALQMIPGRYHYYYEYTTAVLK